MGNRRFARASALLRCERPVSLVLANDPTDLGFETEAEIAFHQSDDGTVHATDTRPFIRSGRIQLRASVVTEDGKRLLVGTTAILGEVRFVLASFFFVFALVTPLLLAALLSGLPAKSAILALLVWAAFGAAPALVWAVVRGVSEDSHDFVVRAVGRRMRR